VWEQVLLLSIYARQTYFSDKGNQLHQRSKLIHGLRFSGRHKLMPFILELIEKGCSNTEIISFLLKLKENKDINKNVGEELTENLTIVEKLLIKIKPKLERESHSIISNANEILRYLEEKQIAFSALNNNEHPYSYYSMYQALSKPFLIFNKMLSVDLSLEELDRTVLFLFREYLKNKKKNFTTPLFSIQEFIDNNTFEKILNHIEVNEFNINFDDLNIFIKSGILKKLSYDSRDVFSFIQDFKYLERNEDQNFLNTNSIQTPLSEISDIHSNGEELAIFFDKNTLKDLIHLGQADSVMAGVKEKILEILDDSYFRTENGKNFQETNANALRKLELWHKKLDTKFIKKTDQITKLIS